MYAHYRADLTFKRLNDWLRLKKVPGRNPLHTLRKEYGSLVCQKFGLYAASRALRHRNIQTTTAYYLDMKARATAGLGHLLATPSNVVQVQPEELQKPGPRAARS
jgi:integrase